MHLCYKATHQYQLLLKRPAINSMPSVVNLYIYKHFEDLSLNATKICFSLYSRPYISQLPVKGMSFGKKLKKRYKGAERAQNF